MPHITQNLDVDSCQALQQRDWRTMAIPVVPVAGAHQPPPSLRSHVQDHKSTAKRCTPQVLRLEYLEEESKEFAADRDAARQQAAQARAEAAAFRQEAVAARSEAARARLAAAAAQARADAAEQLPPAAQLVRSLRCCNWTLEVQSSHEHLRSVASDIQSLPVTLVTSTATPCAGLSNWPHKQHHGRAASETKLNSHHICNLTVFGPGVAQGSASPQQRPLSRVSPGGFPAVSPPPPAESPIRGHPARGGAEPDPGFLATGDDAWADAPTVEVLLPLQSSFSA